VELEVETPGEAWHIDAFEFGAETATFTNAGMYRVTARMLPGPNPAPASIILSRASVPVLLAHLWTKAETAATAAKSAGNLESIRASLQLWEALGYVPGIARTHLILGDKLFANEEFVGARIEYEDALARCTEIGDWRCAAEAANNSGYAAQRLGEFDTALDRLDLAARYWGHCHDFVPEALTRSNLGMLHQRLGEFEAAIRELSRAEPMLRGRDRAHHARVLNRLGVSHLSLAEPERAQRYFEQVLAECEPSSRPSDVLWVRANLGGAYLLEGKLQQALKTAEAVLADVGTPADRALHAYALDLLGHVLLELQRYPEAEARLTLALALDESIADRRRSAFDLYYLGLAAMRQGRAAQARERLHRALNIRTECGLREEVGDTLLTLAELERDAGDVKAALGFAERSLSYLESARITAPGASLRASFSARKRKLFDLMVELAMAAGGDDAASAGLLAAEKGRARALMDMLAEGSLLRNIPADLRERRADIQRRMDRASTRLLAAKEAERPELLRGVETLRTQDEEVEAEIQATVSGQRLGQPLQAVAQVQAALEPGSALLEYHLGERQSHAWLVDRERIRAFTLPPRDQIDAQCKAVSDWLGRIQDRRRSPANEARFQTALRDLSTTLLGPLAGERLPERLILALDGALHRVPFAALRTGPRTPCLGVRHELIETPSAAYLIAGRTPRPLDAFPRTFLAVVDPVFSATDPRLGTLRKTAAADGQAELARLPFTGELDVVRAAVAAARRLVLSGFEASRAGLAKLPLEDFAIVHFSTHARIDDQIPDLSRIALSTFDRNGRPTEGSLRPYQLAKLRLNGSLVALSACDSALGKQVMGEGLEGFTSSLFAAGAAQLVLTLTEVDAEASSEFLSGVYRRMLQQHLNVERAMELTRREMAASERWSDPYYWASMVVMGRPTPAWQAHHVAGSRL
jgi:CHAT domain-containing protein